MSSITDSVSCQKDNFLGIRRVLWPIYKEEYKHFFLLSLLMFCILFNQNVLRVLKDSILVSKIGAEVISFVKVYFVTPIAALFVVIYSRLVNKLSFYQIFRLLMCFFLVFFSIFGFIIYPNIGFFHLSEEVTTPIINSNPHLKWYVLLFANWSYVIFYVLSELWPNIFYVLMFWQITNQTTSTNQASRFYTLLSFFGNSSLVFVGIFISSISSVSFSLDYNDDSAKDIAFMRMSMTSVVVLSLFSMYCTSLIEKNNKKISFDLRSTSPKLGMLDSFRYILKSKYLWLMLICSASFGLCENLVEAIWKDKIKILYPTVNSFAEFTGNYIFWTGIVIMIMNLLGNFIIRKYGWFSSAIITPIVILVTGIMFFILVVFSDLKSFVNIYAFLSMSPLYLIITIGTIQNILAKGAKYSIWDTSREMLYIPLDNELKTKGKAAVDVISSKIGKSMSGFVQAVLFTIFPSIGYDGISFLMMIVFIVTTFLWILAVKKISLLYNEKIKS